jgi:hypothetical protein
MNLENKKIPTSLLLSAVLLLIIANMIKSVKEELFRDWLVYQEKNISVGTNFYCIDILGIEIPYSIVFTALIIIFGIGVYLFLYKTDYEIKNAIKNIVQKLRNILGKLQNTILKTTLKTRRNVSALKVKNIEVDNEYEKYFILSLLSLILFIPLGFFEFYIEIKNYTFAVLIVLSFLSKKVIAFLITKKVAPHIRGEAWFWKLLSVCFPTMTILLITTKIFEKRDLKINSL